MKKPIAAAASPKAKNRANVGTRRLISAEAIADLMPLRLPSSVRARIRQGGVS